MAIHFQDHFNQTERERKFSIKLFQKSLLQKVKSLLYQKEEVERADSNMPYVNDILTHFKKSYGKDWKKRYFAWQGANPTAYAKGVQTAQARGDKIVPSLAKTKAGKEKAKKYG